MGCTCTQYHRISEEEEALGMFERGLLFHKQESKFIDLILRKYSSQGKISHEQFEEAGKALELRLVNQGNLTNIQNFYAQFNRGQHYDLRQLLLLGIILGKGSNEEKAELLFEIYDESSFHEIDNITLGTLLEELSLLFTLRMQSLVNENPICVQAKIIHYLSNCSSQRQRFVSLYKERLLAGRPVIEKSDFIYQLSNLEEGLILRSQGMRNILRNLVSTAIENSQKKINTSPSDLQLIVNNSQMLQQSWVKVAVISAGVLGCIYMIFKYLKKPEQSTRLQQVDVLSKQYLLEILHRIRQLFSERHRQLTKSFRNLRRNEERGSAQYVQYVKEMMDATRETLLLVQQQAIQEFNIDREILESSRIYYENDPQVKLALRKMCVPIPQSYDYSGEFMREVLTYYLTRLNQIEYYDITQLAIQMQILADDLFDEFEIESEELEFAHDCMDNRVKQLTRKINKKTEELIDEAVINLPKRSQSYKMADQLERILNDPKALRKIAKDSFNHVDADGSGFIEEEELMEAMTRMSQALGTEPPSYNQVIETMRAIDENSDGQVSLDEYVTLVRATLDRVLRILKGEDVDDDIAASARRSLQKQAFERQRKLLMEYLQVSGINDAYKMVYAEVLMHKIKANDVFQYGAMRLRQIGNEVKHLLPKDLTANLKRK